MLFRQRDKRALSEQDTDTKSLLPGSKFDRYLQARQDKSRLLHETREPPAQISGRFSMPARPQRLLDQPAEEIDFKNINNSQMRLEDVLRLRKERLQKARDAYETRIDDLNAQRGQLLDRRNQLREDRRVLDQKPLTPPFKDDGLPKTLQYNWEAIGSRNPPDASKYRKKHPEPVPDIVREVKKNFDYEERRHQLKKVLHLQNRDNLTKPYRGELGIESYEPWQLGSYYLCRDIAEQEIERALNLIFGEKHYSRDHISAEMSAHAQQKALQLIMEELVLEATGEMALLAAREYIYLHSMANNMSDQAVMHQSEAQFTGNIRGRHFNDPIYDKEVKLYYRLQKEREKVKPELWKHDFARQIERVREQPTVQPIISEGIKPPEEEPEPEPEIIEDDKTIIDYTLLIPSELQLQVEIDDEEDIVLKKNLKKLKEFYNLELRYWGKITPSYTAVTLSQQSQGIQIMKVSPNNRFLAIGSRRGDIAVYNIYRRLKGGNINSIRSSPADASNPSAIISLEWSKDSDGLIAVAQNGTVKVFSMQYAPLPPQHDPSTKRRQSGVPSKTPLALLASIPASAFTLTSGPIAEKPSLSFHGNDWHPNGGFYFPSFNILGGQSEVCVTMKSYDFIKFDVEKFTRDEHEIESPPELIKRQKVDDIPIHAFTDKEVQSEIFAEHKYPIICCGLIQNTGDIVTVDATGILSHWRYERSFYSDGRQGFRPFKVYRIRMDKNNYEFDPSIPVMFRFDIARYDKFEDKLEIAEDRELAEKEIKRSKLRIPWITKTEEKTKITTIYKPELEYISASGGAFHEVTRFKSNNLLTKYVTKVYKPYKIEAEALLGCNINRAGTRAVAMILYPTDPDFEEHHIEVCVIDLHIMKAVDPRIKIPLTEKEYKQIQRFYRTPMTITSCYNFTLTEYLITNIAGLVYIYSLVTGQCVAKTIQVDTKGDQVSSGPRYRGCVLPLSLYRASQENMLATIGQAYEMDFLIAKPGDQSCKIILLQDNNTLITKRQIADVLDGFDWTHREDRTVRAAWREMFIMTKDHIAAFCADIVYDMVDNAMQNSREITYTKETIDEHEEINRVCCYNNLDSRVSDIREKTGEANMPLLRGKRKDGQATLR